MSTINNSINASFGINQLLYAPSATTLGGLATANNSVLITSGAGVPSISSTLPSAVQTNITKLGTITSDLVVTGNSLLTNGGFNPSSYNTGTVTIVDGGVTGSGTTFTSAMVGGIFEITSGVSAGQSSVVFSYTSATSIELFDVINAVAGSTYVIKYGNVSFAAQGFGINSATTVLGAPLWNNAQVFPGITSQLTSNQLILGTSSTTTISATAPSGNRIYTMPDAGANAHFVLSDTAGTTTLIGPYVKATTSQTVVGNGASPSVSGTGNTIVGHAAGTTLTTGTNNIIIGDSADVAASSAIGRVVIGQGVTVSNNHQVVLGDSGCLSWVSPNAWGTALGNTSSPFASLALGTGGTTLARILPVNYSSNRVYTMQDAAQDTNFVMTDFTGGQTISTAVTLGTALTITPVTNQLVLGTTHTTTLTSVAPAASRTYTIADAGGAAQFIMSAFGSAQTVSSIVNFTNATTATTTSTGAIVVTGGIGVGDSIWAAGSLNSTKTTNQLVFQTANATTVTAPNPAAARTYTIPDYGAAANFALTTATNGKVISQIVSQVFTATGTYTPTAGMVYIEVECQGSGGGGGGATSGAGNGGAGGGGQGGCWAKSTITAATVGASQSVTIGAAGTAGSAGNNAGGTGGTASFGALVSAAGGAGGSGGAAGGPGGNGGFLAGSVSGDITYLGYAGFPGIAQPVVTLYAQIGAGGNSKYGAGGRSQPFNGNLSANVGTGFGGGGSGGGSWNGAGDIAGGVGSKGIVIIREYIAV